MNFPFSFIPGSPAANSVTFTMTPGLTVPIAAGTTVGTLTVGPAGWSGMLLLTPQPGDDDALFSLMGTSVVATTPITVVRQYNGNVTPTP